MKVEYFGDSGLRERFLRGGVFCFLVRFISGGDRRDQRSRRHEGEKAENF